jgi:hypothetical protein
MRSRLGLTAILCCVASIGAITYLHGFERALGHVDWQYRPALIHAYSSEVVFHAGPCVVLAVVVIFSMRLGVWSGFTAAVAIVGAVLSVAGTFLTIRQYIATTPGQFMPTTVWEGVTALTWVAAAILLVVLAGMVVRKLRRGTAEPVNRL